YNGDMYCAKSNAVLKFQDTSWILVGSCTGDAHCLKVFDGKLIAGGEFSKINSTTVHYIAQYDGSTWSSIGNGFTGLDHDVECLAVYNGQLIAGGFFETEFGDTTQLNNIARWDGSKWQPLAGGIPDGNVETMDTFQGELYASGVYMQYADTVACNKIARWNGTTWQAVGTNEGVQSNELHTYKDRLYSTGSMTQNGSTFTVGYWDDIKWNDISGDTIGYSTYSLDFLHDTLYLGGLGIFPYNGDFVGTAMLDLNTISTSNDAVKETTAIKLFPNPTNDVFKISCDQGQGKQLILFNSTGRMIFEKQVTCGDRVNVSELPDGIYFVKIRSASNNWNGKIIISR
ncbi:MAG: T9SS type A sorting domain-containing protein, partial [Chitinophagales bacterium]